MYVDTDKAWLGPLVFAQLVTPATPVIAHWPVGLGATAPVGPVTTAVNVIVEPRVAVLWFAVTAIVGVAVPTVTGEPDCGDVAK